MTMRSALSCLALVGLLSAQTPITIQDRNAIFLYSTYPNSPTDTAISCAFLTGGVDHVAASWWYYRVAGDATGSAFNSSGSQFTASVSSDRRTGTLEWANVDNRNFAARMVNCVYSTGNTTGTTAQSMTITNNTGAPLTITVYAYSDIDIDGISSDDSAFQMAGQPAGQTRVTDPSNNNLYFMGNGYGGWQAAPWPTLRDAILTTAHTLTNGTLPLTNQDHSGAFSWTVTIAPGASERMHSLISTNLVPRSNNVASAVNFGTAKPGTAGLPAWTLNRPFSGTTANLQVTNGLTGSAPVVFLGANTTNFPFPPFGTVFVIPDTSFNMPAFNATGVSTFGLPVPPINAGVVHFQALWGDAGASGGVAHTGGLTWTIGSF